MRRKGTGATEGYTVLQGTGAKRRLGPLYGYAAPRNPGSTEPGKIRFGSSPHDCERLDVTTSVWDDGNMAKQKTTIYLDPDVLTATKAAALTSKRTESAVVEEALRSYLRGGRGEAVRDELRELLDRVTQASDLDEDAALSMAVDEVHSVRRERRTPQMRGA